MSYDHRPIEPHYIKQITLMAQTLDRILNGKKKGSGRLNGYVVLVFPFGDVTGRANYISNGADRKDIAILFREMAAKFEGQAEEAGHA